MHVDKCHTILLPNHAYKRGAKTSYQKVRLGSKVYGNFSMLKCKKKHCLLLTLGILINQAYVMYIVKILRFYEMSSVYLLLKILVVRIKVIILLKSF